MEVEEQTPCSSRSLSQNQSQLMQTRSQSVNRTRSILHFSNSIQSQNSSSHTAPRKRTRNSPFDNTSDVEETQPSQSARKDETHELVQDIAQYMMASSFRRGFVRDSHLSKFFETIDRETREYLLMKVQKNLSSVFGIKVIRDEEAKTYYLGTSLHWALPAESIRSLHSRNDFSNEYEIKKRADNFKDGVLLTTLMFIFMAKNNLTTIENERGIRGDDLRQFLQSVGAISREQYIAWLGPPVKICEFVSQGWLSFKMEKNSSGDDEFFYDWGPRSKSVISKKDILQMFCSIDGSDPKDWPQHAERCGFLQNTPDA